MLAVLALGRAFPLCNDLRCGTPLALVPGTEERMTLQTFIRQHFSTASGESPVGHALAIVVGFVLLVISTVLLASIPWIPAGVVIGIAGLLALIFGVWGHITSPVNLEDLADSMVKLTGAAIAMTFGLAAAAMVAGFVLTVLVSLIRWLVS
jgi:hypothetical protein